MAKKLGSIIWSIDIDSNVQRRDVHASIQEDMSDLDFRLHLHYNRQKSESGSWIA